MPEARAAVPATPEGRSGFRFRFRGGEGSRLEAFSDAVFAFALTLLVVSLEVPRTFGELAQRMRGFFAFAICFALLVWLWHEHVQFFRRYALKDGLTVVLNSVLLFVVMFYVYPLKFLWSFLVDGLVLGNSHLSTVLNRGESPQLFYIYGFGFAAIFFSFAMLYANAWRQRRVLKLDEVELSDTRYHIWDNFSVGSIGLISVVVMWLGGAPWAPVAGFSYALIGLVKFLNGYLHGKARERIEKRLAESEA